ADVVRAEHDVDPRRPTGDLAPVLLGQATADRDLHVRVGQLDRAQVAEVAVQPVVGVLPDRTGVEHHQVGHAVALVAHVAGLLQQTGDPLGVVQVHLTAVRADLVGADGRGRAALPGGTG